MTVQNFYLQSFELELELEVLEFSCESKKQTTFNNLFFLVMILQIFLAGNSRHYIDEVSRVTIIEIKN